MKPLNTLPKNSLFFLFALFVSLGTISQNNTESPVLLQKNDTIYQETVYVHLNKSTYVKGEHIGLTGYIFNKSTRELSTETTNLYCTISDENNNTIKSKLIKVINGIATGNFILDDSFKSNNYIFKAYTSWMLNFKTKNYFVEKITVLDNTIPKTSTSNITDIDAQFLPESGTLLYNTENTLGVIVKNNFGNGIPNVKGVLLENNKKIRTFNLNKLGIGRFSFLPKKGNIYKVYLNYENKNKEFNLLQNVKEKGVILKVAQIDNAAIISVSTNISTIKDIKNKIYFLKVNNNQPKPFKLSFNNNHSITKRLILKKLPIGINTITLINDNNLVVAERLFFNYYGLDILKVKSSKIRKNKDTIKASFTLSDLDDINSGNVSISILPEKTFSYNKQHNIISQTLLQPYIKSFIEDGGYYFKDINNIKKYHLDNLLITQGWSSYDWPDIDKKFVYPFEKGINVKINIANSGKKGSYLVHHTKNQGSKIIEYDESIKAIQLDNYYLEENGKLYISSINKKGKLNKPKTGLYLQYFPAEVPNLNAHYFLKSKSIEENTSIEDYSKFYNINKLTQLDTIVVKANKREIELENLRKETMGKLLVLDRFDKNMTLAQFLVTQSGIYAQDNFIDGTFIVLNTQMVGDAKRMAVFLDGILYYDNTRFFNFSINDVEYILIDLFDISGGIAFPGGTIKIKTDPFWDYRERETATSFQFPLAFSTPKKFYQPKYSSFQNTFFKRYGVIDWLPKNKIENNNIKLQFRSKQKDKVKLFIEGVTNSGKFISQEIFLDLNDDI